MTRYTLPLAAALIATALAAPAFAQPAAPTTGVVLPKVALVPAVDPMKIDITALGRGLRTSKVVGMTVVNDANETLGTIDDLIVMPNETVPYAVLSVGGFLGMGSHYVVVPYATLETRDKKMLLPHATKDSLKALPVFKYAA